MKARCTRLLLLVLWAAACNSNTPHLNEGEACESSNVCNTGLICSDSQCVRACNRGDDCRPGDGCRTGACGACVEDLDCGGHLRCNTTTHACYSACEDASQCQESSYCEADHTCQLRGNLGDHCERDEMCKIGVCVEKLCCDSACDGTCMRCDTPGQEGVCTPALYATDNTCQPGASGVFACDGAAACVAPHMVKDINASAASNVHCFTEGTQGLVYFQADDGVNGAELWVTDATETGTRLAQDIISGGSSYPGGAAGTESACDIVTVNTQLLFRATNQPSKEELYAMTDGVATLLKDIGGAGSGNPRELTTAGNLVFFHANDETHGDEPWISNGNADGTSLLIDVNSNATSSQPKDFARLGNGMIFTAVTSSGSRELYLSSGTADTTNVIKETTLPANRYYDPQQTQTVGDQVFFSAAQEGNPTANNNRELWVTDGTPLGTHMTRDINTYGASTPGPCLAVGNKAYFAATSSEVGRELWISDGTLDGTKLVANVNAGTIGSDPQPVAALGTTAYFTATTGTTPPLKLQLYRTNGTPETTSPAIDFAFKSLTNPSSFVAFNGWIYFVANSPSATAELWISNGTTDGTYRACPETPGCKGIRVLRVAHGHLFIVGDFGAGEELGTTP